MSWFTPRCPTCRSKNWGRGFDGIMWQAVCIPCNDRKKAQAAVRKQAELAMRLSNAERKLKEAGL